MSGKRIIIIVGLLLIVVVFSNYSSSTMVREELALCNRDASDLSTYNGTYFTASGNCVNCHNTDPLEQVLIDENGEDVSPVNDWIATMMANSAKDPFWRAKVSHETAVYPNLQVEIENTCTRCHAPQGHYEETMTGGDEFLMADLLGSELGLDGVGCVACHGIKDEQLGELFVGEMIYDENRLAFGPFEDPWDGPMNAQTGFNPVYGEHIRKSELCASCHSLFTETIDMEGMPTGNTFFEQSTYHEWLNSDYPDADEECQSCHVPETEEGVIVSDQPNWLFPQSPFGKHHFVGGNAFMLKLMKEYADELDLAATPEQFDLVLGRTLDQLNSKSVDMELVKTNVENDSLEITVKLKNKAGHKFPSGYPSRLSFIHFKVEDINGNVLFENGILNEDYMIEERDLPFEPHYDRIIAEDQVQIYEMVMIDVEDSVTTVLERAKEPIKDNRLVPKGFSISHSAYDTTIIAGNALLDENFNWNGTIEGTGRDEVTYVVPLNGYVGEITAMAELFYQSLPPRWMEEMFSFSTGPIDTFKTMYENADHTPVLIAEFELETDTEAVGIEEREMDLLTAYPNPSYDGLVYLKNADGIYWEVFDTRGILLDEGIYKSGIQLPETKGVYTLRLKSSGSTKVIQVLNL